MPDNKTNSRSVKRSLWLDNLKGIAIILMVLGHSGAPFTHWIFLFHMAVFYMASGYCWNNKHVATYNSYWQYVWNKIKKLYVPYLICNLVFLLLNNVFIDTGIYASSQEYLDLIGSNDTTLLHSRMTFIEMAKQFVLMSLLIGGTELGGPTWFFSSLFIALVAFASIRFILIRIFKKEKLVLLTEIVISASFLLIAWLISEEKVSFHMFDRMFAAYPLLVIGGWLHRLDNVWNHKWWQLIIVAVLAMGVLLLLNPFGSISMARCKIETPLFFLATSLSGWFLLSSVSKLMPLVPLAKLGESTRSIVMWHFISMKCVTWAYIIIVGLPMILLGAFPFLDNTTPYMWVIYTIIGVGLPYLLGIVYDAIKNKLIVNKK